MGLDAITTLPPDPDLSGIQDLVDGYPAEVLQRPQGEVDILLGLRNSALHGSTVRQWENLRLLESPLGCGWSLRGTHPALESTAPRLGPSLSAAAYMLQQAEPGLLRRRTRVPHRARTRVPGARGTRGGPPSSLPQVQGLSGLHF